MYPSVRSVSTCSALRTFASVAVFAPWTLTPVQAQEAGQLRVLLGVVGEPGPFMVSCIHEGAVVFQTEDDVGGGPYCMIGGSRDIPVGVYDVRVEGDGMLTQVRRGVLVTALNQTNLHVAMELGEGVRSVEYSTGALAREEVADRLRALEGGRTVADDRLTTLERQIADLIRGADRR
jgi:hypothetical protein